MMHDCPIDYCVITHVPAPTQHGNLLLYLALTDFLINISSLNLLSQ